MWWAQTGNFMVWLYITEPDQIFFLSRCYATPVLFFFLPCRTFFLFIREFLSLTLGAVYPLMRFGPTWLRNSCLFLRKWATQSTLKCDDSYLSLTERNGKNKTLVTALILIIYVGTTTMAQMRKYLQQYWDQMLVIYLPIS